MVEKDNVLLTTALENILDIYVLADGILCSISDEHQNVVLRKELHIPIHSKMDIHFVEKFFHQPEFDLINENVNIHIINFGYQLIPSELYRQNDSEKLFEMMFGKAENETLLVNVLPKWNMHLVYRIPEKLIVLFNDIYPDAEKKHHIFELLKNFIHRSEEAVYLNILKIAVDLVLLKDSKLQIINTFAVKTDEDICYHTLNIYEQFQLNTENFKLKIKKNSTMSQSAIELLKQYISVVDI
ncbi:MAG: DUF3822 family protein [Paludibacteraceae bacterium]